MTTKAEADRAAREFKRTKPILDAVKEDKKTNDAARDVLASYMNENGVTEHRGIKMREVGFGCWDNGKLRALLGDKAKDFRGTVTRHYFDLIKPKRAS